MRDGNELVGNYYVADFFQNVLEVTMRDGNIRAHILQNGMRNYNCFRSDYEGWKRQIFPH